MACLALGSMSTWASAEDDRTIMGACCMNSGVCYQQSDLMCSIWGGIFFPNQECEDVECPTNCGNGCSPNEIYDCYGHCFPVSWIGDGYCDDGDFQWDTVEIHLDCVELGWDGGDCEIPDDAPLTPGACCYRSLVDCEDVTGCVILTHTECSDTGGHFIGWGTTCLDATCTCPPGFTSDCSNNCIPIHMIGDDLCQDGQTYYPPGVDMDSFIINLSCLELACDGGDCTGNCSGACCVGDTCQSSVSMVNCTELGGVFLGPDMTCNGVDCTDYLEPTSLTIPLEVGDKNDNASLSYRVAAENGLVAVAFLTGPIDGINRAAANLYEVGSQTPTDLIHTSFETNDLPLIDTDGTRVVLSVDNRIAVFQEDGSGDWIEDAIITTDNTSDLHDIDIEGDLIFACWPHHVEIFEFDNSDWSPLTTFESFTVIHDVDATGTTLAVAVPYRVHIFEYPFLSVSSEFVPLYGTNGSLRMQLDGDLMVVSEGEGFYYGEWNTHMPGQVTAFRRTGNSWSSEGVLVALDSKPDDEYGKDIALSGELILVSAPQNDAQGYNVGAVFVFRQIDQSWTNVGKIYPTSTFSHMNFGQNIAADGDTVFAGWSRNGEDDPAVAGAQTCTLSAYEWMTAQGGDINDGSNWMPHLPDEDSTAAISIPTNINIAVADDFPFNSLEVGPSRPNLNLQGTDRELGSDDNAHVVVAGTQNYMGVLGVEYGELEIEGSMQVGLPPYRPGGLKVGLQGSVEVEGDYTQSKLGELHVVLDNRPEGALIVEGDLNLQGTLSVTCPPYNGDPEIGSSWPIILAEGGLDIATDRFQIAVLPGVGSGKYMKINYVEGLRGGVTITLSVEEIVGLLDLENSGNVSIDGIATGVVVTDLGSPDGPPDGLDDIALSISGTPGEVYIFLNDGEGNIDSQIVYSAGNGPSSIDAGDFDVDGMTDLVVTNADDDTVFLLLNNGGDAASMTMQTPVATGDNPVDLAVLDIDNDDLDDVAVSCAGYGDVLPDGSIYGQVDFFRSDPAMRAGLLKLGAVETGEMPGLIDPGELGNDKGGRKLVATLRSGNQVGILGQTDAGGFDWELEETVVVGGDPNALDTGDLDSDGIDDAVIGNLDSGNVSILLGNDGGGLDAESTFTVGEQPQSLTLLDYDGDGDLDLAVIAELDSGEPAVLIYRNDTSLNTGCEVTFSFEQVLEEGAGPILVSNGNLDFDIADDLVAITDPNPFRSGESTPMQMSILSVPKGSTGICYDLGDVFPDGFVNIDDLLVLLNSWGTQYNDINGDHIVTIDDLLIIINNWGPCPD